MNTSQKSPPDQINIKLRILKGGFVIFVVMLALRSLFFFGSDFTEGQVVRFESKGSGKGSHVVTTIDFTTNNGQDASFTTTENLRLQKLEKVPVIYKTSDPTGCIHL